MNKDHSVIFETAPSTASQTCVDYEGYSISSKGFLPTVVDIMVIWIKATHPVHFSSLIPKMWVITLVISFDHFQFVLIHGPKIPGSNAILLFRALDFTSITSHIHNLVLLLLWLHLFILSGVISPLISSSMLGTYWPGGVLPSVFYPFAFSYCSWGSQGKNTDVVCHSLLQWITFCQTSPPWPTCLGWPHGHGLVSLS